MSEVESMIRDHEKNILSGETIDKNKDPLYDIFHWKQEEDEITYPKDSELKYLPLHEGSEKIHRDLDEYIGTYIKLIDDEGIPILARVWKLNWNQKPKSNIRLESFCSWICRWKSWRIKH